MSSSIPLPPTQEFVSVDYLASRQESSLALSRGFGGISNPTVLWQAMISDSQSAFSFYRELEEKDDDVGGLLEVMKLLVLALDRQVLPKDDSSEAADTAQFVQEQLASVSGVHQVLDAMLDAPAYGVSITECLFDVSSGQVGLLDLRDCPQEMFTFNPPGKAQVGPLRFLRDQLTADGGELVPEEKFLVWSYRPRTRNRRGRPLLRSVFWPSWFKRQALRMWLRFGEKGPGTAAAKYPAGASDDEKQKALGLAEAIIEKIAVAVPDNTSLITELLTSARSQNPAVYEKMMERMELAITRRILHQTLTTRGNEGGTGSLALGDVHEDLLFLTICEIATALETVLNDQLVKRLVTWNYGPMAPMPKWTLNKERAKDLLQLVNVDKTLQSMGVPFALKYLQGKYSIPEIQAGDEVVKPTQSSISIPGITGAQNDPTVPFAEPEEVTRATADVRRLMEQLKSEAGDAYRARVMELIRSVQPGGAQ